MVSIDNSKCTLCGVCTGLYGGYCLNEKDGKVAIDYSVCNACQKCISVCPSMAFSFNGIAPERINTPLPVPPEAFMELLRRRRSIKHFKDKEVPKETLKMLVEAAQYAPTMNKGIELIVIDDQNVISDLNSYALGQVKRMYTLLFGSRLLYRFFSLFAQTLPIIKRKMERDLIKRKSILKDNTQALIIVIGDTSVPVTASSGQYYLANMLLYAETLGLGSCLMDSMKIAINGSGKARELLCIPKGFKVLGVLSMGYPAERILNIPRGYAVKAGWNARGNTLLDITNY